MEGGNKNSDWLKENWFKLGILIAILAIAYSFYHTLVVKPQVEAKREEAEKVAEQERQEALKTEKETQLSSCLGAVDDSYTSNWLSSCKTLSRVTQKCIDMNELDFSDYLSKYNLTIEGYASERDIDFPGPGASSTELISARIDALIDYGKRAEECLCLLPNSTAERWDQLRKEDQDRCYQRYSD